MAAVSVSSILARRVLGTAIIALHGQTLPVLLIVALAVIVFFGVLRSIDQSVTAHPELATEYVAYRKAELAAKNISVIHTAALPIPDPNPTPPLIDGGPEEAPPEEEQ